MEKKKKEKKKRRGKTRLILNRLARVRRGTAAEYDWVWYAFLLKLNDRRFAGFLAFIRPVHHWITQQWSFAPILSPWNARFSLLLVLGKYNYAIGQQPSWRVPPYFRQISPASPLRMRENINSINNVIQRSRVRPGWFLSSELFPLQDRGQTTRTNRKSHVWSIDLSFWWLYALLPVLRSVRCNLCKRFFCEIASLYDCSAR